MIDILKYVYHIQAKFVPRIITCKLYHLLQQMDRPNNILNFVIGREELKGTIYALNMLGLGI